MQERYKLHVETLIQFNMWEIVIEFYLTPVQETKT
jgi:hypothetical protein